MNDIHSLWRKLYVVLKHCLKCLLCKSFQGYLRFWNQYADNIIYHFSKMGIFSYSPLAFFFNNSSNNNNKNNFHYSFLFFSEGININRNSRANIKIFIFFGIQYSVRHRSFFFFFLTVPRGLWDLSFPARDWTRALGIESAES